MVCLDCINRCAMTRRMLLIGISVKTPVGTGATPGLGGGTAAAGVGAALVGTKESMSFLMILPSGPVPFTCVRSIPFSAANFFASGLTNTLPFGPAGAAGRGLKVEGLQVGELEEQGLPEMG